MSIGIEKIMSEAISFEKIYEWTRASEHYVQALGMIDEEDYSEFCPGGPDRDGMRALTGGTLAAFYSGILQGNESALSVLSNPGAAPVPVTMEKNKRGSACPDTIPTLSEWGMIILMTIIMGIGITTLFSRKEGYSRIHSDRKKNF